ncbi:hypothetical protein [Vagococcus intermedius]|uniref:Uncharacterized protein n=1 Tax=Vagococcus intermedius TaxID=2991418 RepID=A0AAF0I7K1_9ENTE|nr:hypothetical protein [Vagococcus intermedius]WEG74413.1 hypothetical protein OL234_10645 [Vagococcus intermedius]WEG76533.1 hypothetical protein OL235_10815 [Vagococcus intermedius]
MRLKERELITVYLKKHLVTENSDGDETIIYSDKSVELKMNVQNAGGTVNAQIYGMRLPYIKACKYQGLVIKEGENELDGLCVFVESEDRPDYHIQSIQTFSTHLNIMIERL